MRSKHFGEEKGKELLRAPLPCVCFFGCPSRCAMPQEGKKQHQSAEGLLYLCLAHFPKLCELNVEKWRCGTPAIAVLCGRGQRAMASYSYIFPNLASSA